MALRVIPGGVMTNLYSLQKMVEALVQQLPEDANGVTVMVYMNGFSELLSSLVIQGQMIRVIFLAESELNPKGTVNLTYGQGPFETFEAVNGC